MKFTVSEKGLIYKVLAKERIYRSVFKKIIKQLKTNKILKLALQDPEAKQSIIDSIESLIKEIEQSDK